MNRLKLAELTSGVGALVLGIGLGALFASWLAPAAGLITVTGVLLHAFGMWDKHRLEDRGGTENPRWVVMAYWVCWLLLAGVLAFFVVGRRG
jgi:hypothetical protein